MWSASADGDMKRSDYVSIDSTRLRLLKATCLSATSGVIFSVCSFFLQRLSKYSSGQISFFMMLMQTQLALPVVLRHPLTLKHLFGNCRCALLTATLGIFVAGSNISWAHSVAVLTIVEANVILVSYPVFAMILAHFLLKESFDADRRVLLAVAVAGICLVTKVPVIFFSSKASFHLLGISVAFLGMIFNVFISIICKFLGEVNFHAATMCSGVTGIVVSSAFTALFQKFDLFRCGWDAVDAIATCAGVYLGQMCFFWSLQMGEVGALSVVRCAADVVFLFVFQTAVLRQTPDAWTVVGSVMVMAAVTGFTARQEIIAFFCFLKSLTRTKCT